MKQFLPASVNIYKRALFCAGLFFICTAAFAESKYFPIPDIIKPNVEFWIRIYTEISLEDGLLHDRDYPQVVYEKVKSEGRKGRTLSDHIDSRRQIYISAINNIRSNPESSWGPTERKVADLFKLAPRGAIEDAENRIRHQTGQRERFREGVERSTIYLDTISAILKQHGVPDELKYLPHVESSFDAEAYSKVGAAGLWQFMRSTGRSYMKIDYMFDERRDAIKSTHAAAKFLKANYNMLNEWPLAITAYNHGPNGMRRAVAQVGSSDIAVILQKHESPTFKFASKNFYSCFLAVLQIMEDVDKYVKNVKYKPKFAATSIKLPFAMRPDAICRSLNISQQEFARLNPSFRPVVFSQQKPIPSGYSVNIPANIDGTEALASLNRTPRPQRPTPRDIESSGYYTVVSGDNLHNISRRLGISMRDLAEANNITNSSKIYVGQVLVIPSAVVAAAPKDTVTVALADTETNETEIIIDDTETADSKDTVKTVSADTIRTVAAAEKSPAKSITAASSAGSKKAAPAPVAKKTEKTKPQPVPTADDTPKGPLWHEPAEPVVPLIPILPADKAAIMTDDTISTLVAFSEAVSEPKADSYHKPSTATYFDAEVYDLGMTVAPGAMSVKVKVSVDETVGHFAEWMNVGASQIRRLNNLSPNAGLQMGRYISIPIGRSSDLKKFEVSRLEYHMAIEEDFFARYSIVDFEQRPIKRGESLWRICNQAKIPLWLLKKFNRGVDVFALKPGDKIWIPKVNAKDSHGVPSLPFESEIGDLSEE